MAASLLKGEILLTPTEREILRRASEGIRNNQIALERKVSAETIKRHLKNVFNKLDVHNKIEALFKLDML